MNVPSPQTGARSTAARSQHARTQAQRRRIPRPPGPRDQQNANALIGSVAESTQLNDLRARRAALRVRGTLLMKDFASARSAQTQSCNQQCRLDPAPNCHRKRRVPACDRTSRDRWCRQIGASPYIGDRASMSVPRTWSGGQGLSTALHEPGIEEARGISRSKQSTRMCRAGDAERSEIELNLLSS